MKSQDDAKKQNAPRRTGLEMNCHRCGRALPLLHPHIMVERMDENENLICEWCYEEYYASKNKD
ncbi:hypothetical protein [Desulforhabdus amnigena]|jgi:uncharacterized Zn-finger protein|uniref:Uncharacterized protein n=1 Tax=Desulforhabdus amnigena TaxID=40218 RepID=A0A9W6D4N9_9BACT|nr:hypothetical protein [Desulforhabdus amnigena]NLJ28256.1 hypothetical protein [Deltaproteobacteria bacterium]GLI34824.1 hypothetical protein DAMNIGENAA_22570 [Desulforhabdus amnigena]